MTGLGLAQVLDLATLNPGRFAGGRGKLAIGEAADMILFDWKAGDERLVVAESYLRGDQVWAR